MVIDRGFGKFVVFREESVLHALNKINANRARIIFVVSEAGELEGVLSDGDFRRWITSQSDVKLDGPVAAAMNRDFVSAAYSTDRSGIKGLFKRGVVAIPLVDMQNRLVAVAFPELDRIDIDGRVIANDGKTFIISEVGNNHNGSLELALRLIDLAAAAGADSVKFQMRDMKTLYSTSISKDASNADLGAQYTLDLLARFQLSDEDMFRSFDYVRERGLVPLCTPWDEVSLNKLENYGLPGYKVASADFTNHLLLEAIAETGKPLFCSTGMCSDQEIREGIALLDGVGANYALLHCNSTYPAPFKDVNLAYIARLRELSGRLVGYSGHERDIYVSVAAVALGARIIEKHFTVDKTLEGNDHKVSLLPVEFESLVVGVRQVELSLGTDAERTISQGELMNRENLAKSLVASCDLEAGVVISSDMLGVRSPGHGMQPNRRSSLVGRVLKVSKGAGDAFFESDVAEKEGAAGSFDYHGARFGFPVRYHDCMSLIEKSNPDFVEMHLSYRDLELDFNRFLPSFVPVGLVVHAPELFSGDHTLDLCSLDDDYRKRSVGEMQKVISLSRRLADVFDNRDDVGIVVNVGGFSVSGHLSEVQKRMRLDMLLLSLSEIDSVGVQLWPQTMPPFPWHFGGQQFHNLFVGCDFIAEFCRNYGYKVCLDVSHSKLACTHSGHSFEEFLRTVLPFSAHLHLADAKGVDGEGIQIGHGEIDWSSFWRLYREVAPSASFIPEIWQGHKNGGEAMWLGMRYLEGVSGRFEASSKL